MKTMIVGLKPHIKQTLIYALIAFFLIILISFKMWISVVAFMYLTTWLYVYLYFKSNENKSSNIYFYFGFMVLFVMAYATIYMELGVIDTGESKAILDKYDYYYFSLVTWTTLGYGDFKPTSEARLYASSQALLGYLYMGILIAKFFDWMSQKKGNDESSIKNEGSLPTKIKSDNIAYRKGYVEVSADIHSGYINIETWQVDAEVDLSKSDIDDENFSDEHVTSNTEIEMSPEEAERLIIALQAATKQANIE